MWGRCEERLLYLSFLISLSSCLFLLSYMATTSMLGGEGVGEGMPLELPPLALVVGRYSHYHQRLLIQMTMSLKQVKRHQMVSFSLSLRWFAQSNRCPQKRKLKKTVLVVIPGWWRRRHEARHFNSGIDHQGSPVVVSRQNLGPLGGSNLKLQNFLLFIFKLDLLPETRSGVARNASPFFVNPDLLERQKTAFVLKPLYCSLF